MISLSTAQTIDRSITLYSVFNQHQNPAIPYELLTRAQKRGREAVAEFMAADRAEISMLEGINTELRGRLWNIMFQCADQLGVNIEVDRY